MPFHELKIDRGFVHGAGADATLGAIFEASVSLAKHLGMQIVAEGVEDRDDWDLVQRAECDTAQGYFIAKPMPAEALPGWLAGWKERALVAC
jgi:EAL domain-containing protein (putative c-di-GMP-specific phosphodiesterase class I)